MSGRYRIIRGDVTKPHRTREQIIVPHVVNNVGGWGRGVSGAIGSRWPLAEENYRRCWQMFSLGDVQVWEVEPGTRVASMFAQNGVDADAPSRAEDVYGYRPPIRYAALARCMSVVAEVAREHTAEIHCPAFGAGLAGGRWQVVMQMIWETWCDHGLDVTIYMM